MTEKDLVFKTLTVCKSIISAGQIDAGMKYCDLAYNWVSSIEARQIILAAKLKLTRLKNGTDKLFYTPQQFQKPDVNKKRVKRFKRKQ